MTFELPGLHVPGSPRWSTASGTSMRDGDGGNDVLDLAMGFGSALWGHGVPLQELLQPWALGSDHVPAPGLGDLHTHDLREHATQALCAWGARHWGCSADDLRAVVLHTGSEAVETAIKTALRATGRTKIVAFEGAYHGTFGLGLAVTHGERFRAPFAPQYSDAVSFHPYGVVPALDDGVACVIVEPIQGRAGVIAPPEDFLRDLRDACDAVGALLILDDVLVGCGRTAAELPGADVNPDAICLGKALGSGVAASAVLVRRDVAERAWGDVQGEAIHTSTLLGEPIACAGVLHTLAQLERADLAASAAAWMACLCDVAERYDLAVRGGGLLWALDTGQPGGGVELFERLLEAGVLVVPSGPTGSSVTLYPSPEHTAEDRTRLAAAVELAATTAISNR